MKYAVFYKKLDELNGADFDEEVVNQYENITLKDAGLSCIVNGQEVITTIDNIVQDMCEKQIELIFDAFAERIAKKMHEVLQQEPKNGEWIPIIEGNELGEPYQSGVYCSECGETLGYEANYCPNCGVQMKESRCNNEN